MEYATKLGSRWNWPLAGAAALAGLYSLSSRQKQLVDSESAVPSFPTWSEKASPKMGFVRRIGGRRRGYPRRTRRMRRMYVPRYPRLTSSDGYTVIKRTSLNAAGYSISGAANPAVNVFSFQLAYLPNYADFTALYQQYRIRKIDLKIVPRNDFGNANGVGVAAVATSVPQIAIANDTAKTTAPGVYNDVLCYQNCRILSMAGSRPVYHTVYPKSINTVQGVNVAPSTEWLFTTQATIPHYGVQFAWVSATTAIGLDVYATYTIEFRGRA